MKDNTLNLMEQVFGTGLRNNTAHNTADEKQQDSALIQAYQASRNTEYVARLMERYTGHIIAFSVDHFKNYDDVQDFTNDIFLKLCEKLAKEQVTHFKSWLYSFMKNMFYDIKRREQLHTAFVEQQPRSDGYSIDKKIQHRLDHEHLHAALDELSDQERQCIELIYLQGKRYNEIIRETGWTFNQIRGLRDRATKKLRMLVTEELKQSYT